MSTIGQCTNITACAAYPTVGGTNPGPPPTTWYYYCVNVQNNTQASGLAAHSLEEASWTLFKDTVKGTKTLPVGAGGTFCAGNVFIGQWLALVDSTTYEPVTAPYQFSSSDAKSSGSSNITLGALSPIVVPATGILAAKGKCGHIPRGLCKGYPATGGTAKSPVTYYCVEVTNNTKESGVAAVSGDQSTWVPFTTDGTTQLPSIDAGGTFCAANITVGLWFALVDSTGAPVTPLRQFTSKDAESTVGVPSVISLKEESKMWLLLIVLAVLVVAGLGLALLARRSK